MKAEVQPTHAMTEETAVQCKVCDGRARKVFSRNQADGIILESRFHDAGYERGYYRCSTCGLLFHVGFDTLDEEQSTVLHGTGQGDRLDYTINRGLRETEMVRRLMSLYGMSPASKILVFGCGPAISYNLMLQLGMNVYASDQSLGFANVREGIPEQLMRRELMPQMIRRFRSNQELTPESYDLITLTEVFEHFLDPLKEMRRLASLVRPGGMVIGTTGWADRATKPLKEWWYLKPITHATFLSADAFRRICAEAGCLGAVYPGSPALIGDTSMSGSQCVFVMQRPPQ